jgi:hypothetical protein
MMSFRLAVAFVALSGAVLVGLRDAGIAQDAPKAASKEMHVFEPAKATTMAAGIAPPGNDCLDAKIEIRLQNGEAFYTTREIEKNARAMAQGTVGNGKIEMVYGKGSCRISIVIEPGK